MHIIYYYVIYCLKQFESASIYAQTNDVVLVHINKKRGSEKQPPPQVQQTFGMELEDFFLTTTNNNSNNSKGLLRENLFLYIISHSSLLLSYLSSTIKRMKRE